MGNSKMSYQIRQASPSDVLPALNLALRVFMKLETPEYEQGAVAKFKADCVENKEYIENYTSNKYMMFIAVDNEEIVGIVNELGNGRISMLYVDGEHQRQGIATALMERIVCGLKLRGVGKIVLHSSPYSVPFYKYFGFIATDVEQKLNCFTVIPMEYTPNEIWGVLDENGNKTGRYTERGRKMATGDYHLVVHVWKHNGKGEWLIDKRAPRVSDTLGGMWETTGGSAVAGDDSLTAALRETKEELGIDFDPKKGMLFQRIARKGNNGHTWFQDAWIFEHDCPIEAIKLQKGETCDAMWATAEKIKEMIRVGEFLGNEFYPYFDEMMEIYANA